MKIVIMMGILLLGACNDSSRCIALWQESHDDRTPIPYQFAEKCCDWKGCYKSVWKYNSKLKIEE